MEGLKEVKYEKGSKPRWEEHEVEMSRKIKKWSRDEENKRKMEGEDGREAKGKDGR